MKCIRLLLLLRSYMVVMFALLSVGSVWADPTSRAPIDRKIATAQVATVHSQDYGDVTPLTMEKWTGNWAGVSGSASGVYGIESATDGANAGFQFTAMDLSKMNNLHISFYVDNLQEGEENLTFNVKLVTSGEWSENKEAKVSVTVPKEQWTSFDLDLSRFNITDDPTRSSIYQLAFDGFFGGRKVFIDDVYFYEKVPVFTPPRA